MLIFGNLVNCIYMLNHVKLMLPDAPGNNSSPCKDTRHVRVFLCFKEPWWAARSLGLFRAYKLKLCNYATSHNTGTFKARAILSITSEVGFVNPRSILLIVATERWDLYANFSCVNPFCSRYFLTFSPIVVYSITLSFPRAAYLHFIANLSLALCFKASIRLCIPNFILFYIKRYAIFVYLFFKKHLYIVYFMCII